MKKICAKILSGFVLGVVAVMVSLLAMSVGTGAKTKVVTTKNGTKLCCYTSDGNNYEIYEIKNAKKDLIIPETVDGKHKINMFDSRKFLLDCGEVERIHFPSGLKYLCEDLELTEETGRVNTFHCFPNLKEVSFDKRNGYYSAKDGVVYDKKKRLVAIAPGISRVKVASWVTRVIPNAYEDLTKLEHISVEKGNKKYKSIKGVLYSKDGKELVYYPVAKKGTVFRIPNGVKEIGEMACFRQKYIKRLIMSNSVHEIGEYAFAQCASLKKVSLNKKLKILEYCAFYNEKGHWLTLSLPAGIEEVEIASLPVKELEIPAGVKKVELDEELSKIRAKTLIVRSRSLNMIAMDQECWYDAEIDEDDLEESVYKGKTIYAYKDSKAYKQLKPVAEIYGIKLKLLKG